MWDGASSTRVEAGSARRERCGPCVEAVDVVAKGCVAGSCITSEHQQGSLETRAPIRRRSAKHANVHAEAAL